MTTQQTTGQFSTLEPLRAGGTEPISPQGTKQLLDVKLTMLAIAFDDAPHKQTIFIGASLLTPAPAAPPLVNTIPPGCNLTDADLEIQYSVAPVTAHIHLHPPGIPNLAHLPNAPELLAWLAKSGFICQKVARSALLVLFAVLTACSPAFDDYDDDDDDDDAEECAAPHHHHWRPR